MCLLSLYLSIVAFTVHTANANECAGVARRRAGHRLPRRRLCLDVSVQRATCDDASAPGLLSYRPRGRWWIREENNTTIARNQSCFQPITNGMRTKLTRTAIASCFVWMNSTDWTSCSVETKCSALRRKKQNVQ